MTKQKTDAAHTKGPWQIAGASAAPFINIVQAETLCDVCAVSCDDPGPEEQAANARLIAASPTMHAYIQARARQGDVEAKSIIDSLL